MKRLFGLVLIAPLLLACEGLDVKYEYPVKVGPGNQYGYKEPEKFFGKDAMSILCILKFHYPIYQINFHHHLNTIIQVFIYLLFLF